MTKGQLISICNEHLADDELLKALNAILAYLKDKDSNIEPKISSLKNSLVQLEEENIKSNTNDYAERKNKIRERLYLHIKNLPDFNQTKGIENSLEKSTHEPDPNSIWAVVWRLIKKPISLVFLISSILVVFVSIRSTGRDPFCLLFKDCDLVSNNANHLASDSFRRQAQGKDYIIDNITLLINYEKKGNIHVANWKTVYSITALKNIDKMPFPECYFSSYVDTIKHFFGNNNEELKGDGRTYNVFLSMKKGERKTIVTGSIFNYKTPLRLNRIVSHDDTKLNTNQEGYMYNNQDAGDFIESLTMVVESNTLSIKPLFKGARRYSKGNQIFKENAFHNFDRQNFTNSSNTSISYTWNQITPADNVAIYFEW